MENFHVYLSIFNYCPKWTTGEWKQKLDFFSSFSSVSQPKICSSLSEPTLRSFSRHENKTSASHARLWYVCTALVRAMERIVPSAESRPAAVCSGWPAGDRRGARSTGRRGARSRSHCPRPGATSTCGTGRAPPMTMKMSIWLCQSVGIHWTFIVYKRCHDDGGNRGYFERVQSSPFNIAKMQGFTNLIIYHTFNPRLTGGGGVWRPPPEYSRYLKNEQRYRRETWQAFSYNNLTSSVEIFLKIFGNFLRYGRFCDVTTRHFWSKIGQTSRVCGRRSF